jgi:tetratricopeptide (TPR) repeat protein
MSDSPYFRQPLLDSAWYDARAKEVLEGDLLSRGGSFRVPLYTYYLAGTYAVFGASPVAPVAIQFVLGGLTCGLVFLLGRRLFGTLAGALAGFFFAFYRMAIYSDGEVLPTTLFILFTLLTVHSILNFLDRQRTRDSALAGLFLGLAYLTRPEIFVIAGALGIALAALGGKRAFRAIGVMGIVLVITMAAMGLRNQAISGKFSLFSPQGAVNFYVGNARYTSGKAPLAPPTRFPYAITADPTEDAMVVGCRQAAKERVGRDLSDDELTGYYTRESLAEIRADLPRWLGLLVRKTCYLFNSHELSDIKYLPRYIERYSTVLRLPLVTYSLVMPLGLVGLWLVGARRRRSAWVISAASLGSAATCILFFVVWRFRLPAVPFLAVLGGYALSEMVFSAARRQWRNFAGLAAPALVLALLSLPPWCGIKDDEHTATYIANEAAIYTLQGQTEKAIEIYKEAIAADPSDARPYYYVGKAYGSLGRVELAKDALDKARVLNPNYAPFTYLSTGIAFANQGRLAEAADQFAEAIKADPGFAMAYYDYGFSLYGLGLRVEAEAALREAVRQARGDSRVELSAAQILIEMGEMDTGQAVAEAVLSREPGNSMARYTLGLALDRQGRLAEAAAQYERALAGAKSAQEIQEVTQKLSDLRTRQLRR